MKNRIKNHIATSEMKLIDVSLIKSELDGDIDGFTLNNYVQRTFVSKEPIGVDLTEEELEALNDQLIAEGILRRYKSGYLEESIIKGEDNNIYYVLIKIEHYEEQFFDKAEIYGCA